MNRATFKNLLSNYGIIWVTVLLFVLLALTTEPFLSTANLRNILDQQSLLLIAGSALTLTLIGGNFDISTSAIFINAGIVTALTANTTGNALLALVAGTALATLFGVVNGVIVAIARIHSFIATLATSFIFYGIGFMISQRSIIRIGEATISEIARGRNLGITNATWIAILVVAVFWVIQSRTRFGREIYAMGGNEEAARLAGIQVKRVKILTFVVAGAAAGLAGALSTARTLTAQPSDDFSFVFAVLAAVIVGGTSVAGGAGAVWRTVFGALFIALLINGFNLRQVDPIIQRLIQGAVILGAVAADNWSRSRRT